MRFWPYVAAITSASNIYSVTAVPADTRQIDYGAKSQNNRRQSGEPRDADSKTKYFHEPGTDDVLGHYDERYFQGVVDYDTRTDTLHHLMRSYLLFFAEEGLETWIAHGTLLGWWWNGQILPWDWDIDTQVSGETLAYMAKHLNGTIYSYESTSDPTERSDATVSRDYLLDVNPYSWERDRGDGMNIIDARWIDVRNGLYIDITGLSEVHPDTHPGVWQCKNFHKYRIKDLYPMRESVYEGVPAKIPYAYDKILLEEYHEKALVLTEYEGHRWDQQQRLWVRKPKSNVNSHMVSRSVDLEPEPMNNPRKRSWMSEMWAMF